MSVLGIDNIVKVNVRVVPSSPSVATGCNVGLIIGSNNVISKETRVKLCNNLQEVASAGFDTDDAEYKAAALYFAQEPAPTKLYIGRQDKTPKDPEDPDSPEPETVAVALTACKEAAPETFGVYICDSSDADIQQAATTIEALGGVLFYNTNNPDSLVANPEADDIFTLLSEADKKRAFGIYSNTAYAGAALLGLAMGLETGLDGSAFTMAYTNLNGVTSENITKAQLDILLAKNGNAQVTRGQGYKMVQMGRLADGTPYDDLMYIDMTKKLIENNVLGVLVGNKPKRPQTDAGMAVIVSAITNALEKVKNIDYIAEGVWNGENIRDLQKGDVLAGGYAIFVDSFATLSQADREAKKAPPVWVAIKTAGTIESVVINVDINL